MADDEQDTKPETEPNIADAVESGDISILNSLIGQGSPRSLQLWVSIGSGTVHVLIDNGSAHNFVQPDIVKKMQLPVQSTKAFKVYIRSGESLLCESLCSQVMLSMQGLAVKVDLYVLPMKGPDVGDESLRIKRISLHHMHALLVNDDVYGIYELYNVTKESQEVEPPPEETDTTLPELVPLLD
ncbi:reverse transcriptase [Tanacetum coccineum]